jgi:hypothetical protein
MCDKDTYSVGGEASCTKCPRSGVVCEPGKALKFEPGFYLPQTSSDNVSNLQINERTIL